MRRQIGKSPVRESKTLVQDRVQYCPNYDAKAQTGMESATTKVGSIDSRKSSNTKVKY